jgi:hypothetical protein
MEKFKLGNTGLDPVIVIPNDANIARFGHLNEIVDAITELQEIPPGSGIASVVAGDNITVDDTDPLNPIVNAKWPTQSYKVYIALLNQSGETAPTAIELENTLGAITFGYNNEGRYSILCTNLFTYEKTAIFVSPLNNASTEAVSVINEAGSSEYFFDTFIIATAAFGNGLLQNTAIEIRVYN